MIEITAAAFCKSSRTAAVICYFLFWPILPFQKSLALLFVVQELIEISRLQLNKFFFFFKGIAQLYFIICTETNRKKRKSNSYIRNKITFSMPFKRSPERSECFPILQPQFFQVIPKAIIKKSKISDINDLKNILILFFKYLDKNSKVKDVDILLHCMIGKPDKYSDTQINDAIDRHCNTLNENDSNRILFLGLCFTLIESKMIKTSLANFSRFIVNYFLKATSLSEATCISHLGEYKRNSTMISDILETPMFLPTAEKINTLLKKKIY